MNFSASSSLAVGAIEYVEKSISVCMQQEFPVLSAKLGVYEDIRLIRVPIA